MSKSLIQVANPSTQAVAAESIIPLGSVQRRYGCALRLSGNAIEIGGEGYYDIAAAVTVAPTSAGDVTAALYLDGVQLPGATATVTAAASGTVTLPLLTTIRRTCCSGVDTLTCVLVEGAGDVTNISLKVEKS